MRRKRLQPFLGVLALRDEERWRCPYIPKSLVGLETASGHISLNLKSIPFSQSLLEGERGKTSPFLVDSPDGYDLPRSERVVYDIPLPSFCQPLSLSY
jgi:hypothetical protein